MTTTPLEPVSDLRPGPLSSAGVHAALLAQLPRERGALARAIQGVLIHEYLTQHYGVELPEARKRTSQLRHLDQSLEQLLQLDPRPLTAARPPERRLVGVCRHFTLLLTAALRQQGIPARARVGFGAYFTPGAFEDHWLCEHWDASQGRWILHDPQLDAVLCKVLGIDFDPLDVPRDRFVIAWDAWSQCRSGQKDPGRFGFTDDFRGLWYIAGNLIRDLAALNGVEMLPWDAWGAMPEATPELNAEQLAFFDQLAALTREPDRHQGELRARYASDARVRVGASVRNLRTERDEPSELAD